MDSLTKGSALILYIAVMLAIGWWSMRRTRDVGDFFVGGRTIGPWISAFAYGTTYFSAVLFVGFAGKLGWGFGTHVLWIALGNGIVGTLLAWAVLARPTREMTARLGAITMPEFLAARYGAAWLRPAAAVVVFLFLAPYSASVYQGLGYLVEANLGMDYTLAIVLMAAITGIYLVMGGYFAVALTDLIQGTLQVFGVITMVLIIAKASGLGFLGAAMASAEPASAPGLATPPNALIPGWLMLASLVFMTSVGPWGLPQMVQKFYAIRDRGAIRRGMVVATFFSLLIAGGAYYCGALTHAFYPNAAALPQGPAGPDFDRVIPDMLTAHAPEWFAIVVLLVVMAASMSTLSSLVLVSSAAITVDVLGRSRKGDRTGLLAMRVLCGVFVGLSVVIAMTRPAAIVNLMAMSWGCLAGAFIGPYVWGILWRKATPLGAIAGFGLGLATAIALFFVWGVPNSPVAASCAMVVSLIAVPVVSLAVPGRGTELAERAFGDAA